MDPYNDGYDDGNPSNNDYGNPLDNVDGNPLDGDNVSVDKDEPQLLG